jgi:hypothetical protein
MKHGLIVRIGVLLFLMSLSIGLHAQVRNDPEQKLGSSRTDSIPEGSMPLDTPVPMTYILLNDPGTSIIFHDTFIWEDNKHIPFGPFDAHLGNYGSASRSLAPGGYNTLGFSTGWFQYEPTFIQEETFKYYNQDVPVAKIKYSQASQEDTYLTLNFGRSFARGLNLSIEYNRINQIGEFAHQRQKNTGFSIGLWHDAPSGRYDAFYNYLNNAAVAQENGGIAAPELIGEDNLPDANVPINLTTNLNTAVTTHKHRTFMTKQIIHLLPDTNSIGIDVWLKGSFGTGLFKYEDVDAKLAADYYGSDFYVDPRGIRQYTFVQKNEWSAGLALPWKAARSTISGAVRYRGIRIEQEPTERKINEFYVDGRGDFQWVEPLVLYGDFSLGLGQAEGAFSFKVGADLQTGLFGKLSGYWAATSRQPYLIESKLFVTQSPVYAYDFQHPLTNDVGVTWTLEKQLLEAGIKWLVFDHYIYFDSLRFPVQLENSISLRRIYLSKAFDYKSFGIKGSAFWQPDPAAELAVPEWWFTASAYGRISVFDKKLMLMPGIDVAYNGGFTGISYFPVNGVYHLTGRDPIPEAFRVDMGLNLRINFIKAFFRFEDVVGLFKDRVLYQADYYPHYRGYFRIGFEAGFFN